MSGAYDELFGPPKAWVDGIPDDLNEWLTGLAAAIREHGRNPTWARVYDEVKQRWPDHAPKSLKTVSEEVRRRV